MAIAAGSAQAAAGDLLSVTASPASFTALGQNVTFTYVFQSDTSGRTTIGARLTQSAVFSTPFTLNCPTPSTANSNTPISCTAVRTTTLGDVLAGAIHETAKGQIQVSTTSGPVYVGSASTALSVNVPLTLALLTNQVINFVNPGQQVFSPAGLDLVATSSSGLPVIYSSLASNVCTVVNGHVTFVDLGLCIIVASQTGNGIIGAALNAVQIFSVLQGSQTTTFAPLPDRAMGSPSFTLSATSNSGLPVVFAATTPTTCVVVGSTVSLLSQGVCTINALQLGNLLYAAAPVAQQSFTVTAPVLLSQIITFDPVTDHAFGSLPFTVNATASSGLPVTFVSDTPLVCLAVTNVITVQTVGTCTIRASQSGGPGYSAAADFTRSFNVTSPTLLPQTIIFLPLPDQVLGAAPFGVVAVATSLLPVSFAADTPAVCIINGNSVSLLSTGTCTIRAIQAGNSLTAAAPDVTNSFAVAAPTAQSQTISFSPLSNRALGSLPFTVLASASSGLPVTFTSDTPFVCLPVLDVVTLLTVGTCTIRASQVGDGSFDPATDVIQSFSSTNPTLLSQLINLNPIADHTIGDLPFLVSAISSAGLPVAFSSDTPAVCQLNADTVSLVSVGTCTIRATQLGSILFDAAPDVLRSFDVASVPLLSQIITFNALPDVHFGSAPQGISALSSSGLPVTLSSDTPSVCSLNGNTVTLLAVGTCTLRATQLGSSTFAAALARTQSFSSLAAIINPLLQTITFNPVADQTVGSSPFALSAISDSGLPVSFGTDTPAVCSVSGNIVSLDAVGTCIIRASQFGDSIFAGAVDAIQSFDIASIPLLSQVITFNALSDAHLGSAPLAISALSSSGLPVSFSSDTPSVCSVGANTVTLLAVGTCTLRATQLGSSIFAAALDLTQSFNSLAAIINPLFQTITFNPLADHTVGSAPFSLSAISDSGLPVSFGSDTPAICSVSGNTVSLNAVGTCIIRASQLGDSIFAAALDAIQSFNVASVPLLNQILTFNALPDAHLGGAPLAISALSSSGLPVSFSSDTPSVCSVSGNSVTLLAVGTCTLRATQLGSSIFAAALDLTQSFNSLAAIVTPLLQTITFNPLADQTFGSAPFTLSAISNSGLPVSFGSDTPAICSVSGTTVTLNAVGTCIIRATQIGDAIFGAALDVVRSFTCTIAQALSQTITLANLPDRAIGSAPFALAATASSGLPVTFASGSPAVCSVTGVTVSMLSVGACVVTAVQLGNLGFLSVSLSVTFQVTLAPSNLQVAANPSSPALGKTMTITATIPGGNATGTITVWDGLTQVGNATMTGGVAAVSLVPHTAGPRLYAVRYSGNSTYAPAVAQLNLMIQDRPNPALDQTTRAVIDNQVDTMDRFGDGQEGNLDDHLANLHTGTPTVASARLSLNGVPVDALIQPVADTMPSANNLLLWTLGNIEVGQKSGFGMNSGFATKGVTIGFDHAVNERLIVGFAGGIGWDDSRIGYDGTRNQSQSGSLMAYGDYKLTPTTFLDGSAGMLFGGITSDRYSADGNEMLSGERTAWMAFGTLSATHLETVGHLTIAPYAQIKGRTFMARAYDESGSSPWRQSYGAFGSSRMKAAVGANFNQDIPVSWGTLTARAKMEFAMQMSSGFAENIAFADDLSNQGDFGDAGGFTGRAVVGGGLAFRHDAWSGSLDYAYSNNLLNTSSHSLRTSLAVYF